MRFLRESDEYVKAGDLLKPNEIHWRKESAR